jgi:prepilin peptidase CpaA
LATSTILMLALIIAVALPAVWIDTRERRIPNALVLVTLALGVLFQLWAHGPNGGIAALAGVTVGTFFFLPFHVFGAMGAGDVKFMGALGAALGPLGALVAGALALIAGAVLGVAAFFWMQRRRTASAADSSAPVAPPGSATLPYAAAIATGSLGAAWWLAA